MNFQLPIYNKSLKGWSLRKQVILFPSKLNVSPGFDSGNIETLGKQNLLFPSGLVIKCLFIEQVVNIRAVPGS